MFLNVVIEQNYLHPLSPACVCSHTNTQLCLGLCHAGPGNNNAVLLPRVFVTNEGASHDVCVLNGLVCFCVCVCFRHVLTAGRTSSTPKKTVRTTSCLTECVTATPRTWGTLSPSSPATEVRSQTERDTNKASASYLQFDYFWIVEKYFRFCNKKSDPICFLSQFTLAH